MKKLRRSKEIYYKEESEAIKVINLEQEIDSYLELDGVASWIVQEGLNEPLTREELIEYAEEEFEDLPADYKEAINGIIDELLENQVLIESDE